MKRIIFLLFIILTLFLFFSCPSEVVKKTHWEGTIEGDFDSGVFKDEHDLEFYINDDSTCRIIIVFKYTDGSEYDCGLSGTYILDNGNYGFVAEGEADDGQIKIDFEGTLNTTAGIGNGEAEIKYWGGPTPNPKEDWNVSKIY